MTTNFWATIEFLHGQPAAIVELTSVTGEWGGIGRVEVRSGSRFDLYEAGYRYASATATSKGGHLDRFSEFTEKPLHQSPEPQTCGHSPKGVTLDRRPANALNVEIGEPAPRCLLKLPSHWTGSGASALRWLASGGSPLVFGLCTPGANYPARRSI